MSPWVLGTEQASIFPKSKNIWQLRCASKGICRWMISWGKLLETAPKLSRSALHRCLQRHGISRQPATHLPRRHRKFEETTLGFVHIDSSEMKISSGKQHMFVAIDRVTEFTHVAFFDRATKANAAQFLRQGACGLPVSHTYRSDGQRHGLYRARTLQRQRHRHMHRSRLRAHLQVQWRREKAYQAVPPRRTAWSSE